LTGSSTEPSRSDKFFGGWRNGLIYSFEVNFLDLNFGLLDYSSSVLLSSSNPDVSNDSNDKVGVVNFEAFEIFVS
jgi:hypothetical protein